jgi:hypothetical protein
MSCSEEKLSKHLTQTFMAHCNAIVTLSGYAESPKVADAVIEASMAILSGEENTGCHCRSIVTQIAING